MGSWGANLFVWAREDNACRSHQAGQTCKNLDYVSLTLSLKHMSLPSQKLVRNSPWAIVSTNHWASFQGLKKSKAFPSMIHNKTNAPQYVHMSVRSSKSTCAHMHCGHRKTRISETITHHINVFLYPYFYSLCASLLPECSGISDPARH